MPVDTYGSIVVPMGTPSTGVRHKSSLCPASGRLNSRAQRKSAEKKRREKAEARRSRSPRARNQLHSARILANEAGELGSDSTVALNPMGGVSKEGINAPPGRRSNALISKHKTLHPQTSFGLYHDGIVPLTAMAQAQVASARQPLQGRDYHHG